MTDLTIADRCDSCGVQAFVRARLTADEQRHVLLFCGHDFRRAEIALRVAGWQIDDYRHLLNPIPSVSGTVAGEDEV